MYVYSCYCEVMPTAVECVSCCEIEQVANMMKDFDLVHCIFDHEGFEHVCVLNMGGLHFTSYVLFLQTCSGIALVTSGKKVGEFDE